MLGRLVGGDERLIAALGRLVGGDERLIAALGRFAESGQRLSEGSSRWGFRRCVAGHHVSRAGPCFGNVELRSEQQVLATVGHVAARN
jgi:hypothetical protein